MITIKCGRYKTFSNIRQTSRDGQCLGRLQKFDIIYKKDVIIIGKKIELDFDVVGRRFGKLTVNEIALAKRNRQKCVCKCDCGNEISVLLSSLLSGHTKSCGCLRINANQKYSYLIGQTIGKWTVLSLKNKNGICYASCTCECGTIRDVNVYNLINGKSHDCGCGRKQMLSETKCKNILGKRFGKLHVVEKLPESNRFNRNLYRCICDCGNEIVLPSSSISSGHTSSCGCLLSYYNMFIDRLLDEMQVNHQSEYSVDIQGHKLRFDFYLPEYNTFIEYDGQQHYMPITYGYESEEILAERFAKTQLYDQLKNEYCQQNNYNLLRIPYWEHKNIEQIICNHLQRLSEKGA